MNKEKLLSWIKSEMDWNNDLLKPDSGKNEEVKARCKSENFTLNKVKVMIENKDFDK